MVVMQYLCKESSGPKFEIKCLHRVFFLHVGDVFGGLGLSYVHQTANVVHLSTMLCFLHALCAVWSCMWRT
jgi:hypothetical protein